MKYTSALGLTMSGSMGGVTASRNKGGQYLRRRAVPTNPNTPSQQDVRDRLTNAATSYRDLTDDQKESWRTYADNTPVVDTLGVSKKLTPAQWFTSYATTYAQAGKAVLLSAPSVSGRAEEINPTTIELDGADVRFSIAAAVAALEVVLVFISRPQSKGRSFFKGPFQFVGKVTTGAILNVAVADLPWPLDIGDLIFVRTVHIENLTAGGRTSTGSILPILAQEA